MKLDFVQYIKMTILFYSHHLCGLTFLIDIFKVILDKDLSFCFLGDRMGQYHSGQEVYSNSVKVFDTGMYPTSVHWI